ncbi:MAG: hypothetical protein WCO02_07900 [Bacteroidota bacterium]
MNLPGRKFAAYFLVSIMVFYTAGFYLVFELNRFLVKSEMSTQISTNRNLSVEKIVVTGIPRFLKIIGENEVEFRGKMYDVLYRKSVGLTTVYYCIHDSREDNINRGLQTMMKDHIKHLLIPVFGSIAVVPSIDTSHVMTTISFCYRPFLANILTAVVKVPESPPETA